MRALAVLCVVCACFDPRPRAGAPCGADRACPTGLTCSAEGYCESGPGGGDADAGIDAPMIPPDVMRPDPGWYAATPLPAARSLLCAVIAGGNLYAIGGSLAGTQAADVWWAPIADNGQLGAWTATTPLPAPNRWHACAVHAGTSSLYVLGGDLGATASTSVLRAPFAPSGGLGGWTAVTALPAGRRGFGAVADGDQLFAIAGEEADGFTLRATVFVAPIQAGGALGAWATTTPLPEADYMFGTAALGGTVYLTGGYRGGAAVRRAAIGNGALGPYPTTTALPGTRERHGSVALDGHVYVLGGEPKFGTANLRTALRAPIQADGALGAWQALPDLPDAIAYASAAADPRGYIYVVGGSNDSGQVAAVSLLVPP